MIEPTMKLQHKAWLLVVSTIGVLTLASVLVSRHSISKSFQNLELRQSHVESERARRLLNQQLESMSATIMDYAYWTDTVEFTQGKRPDFFEENFGTDNMKYLGLSSVLVLDGLGRAVAGAELTSGPSLAPISESLSHALSSLAVTVLSDKTSKTVMRTYLRWNGELYLVSIAAVHSQFEPGTAPTGAIAAVRNFDAAELTRFSEIIMHPVRLSVSTSQTNPSDLVALIDSATVEARAPIIDHEGRPVAFLILELNRDLLKEGNALALVAALQVALAGLVVGVLLVLLLNRLVLRRIQRTHEELSQMTIEGSESSATLSITENDELTALARGFNVLLIKTRRDAELQKKAHSRQEALHLQLVQSQKTEALGRFTSGIAHDFNNSLAAISGWVTLAKEDLEPKHPSATSLEQAFISIRYASGLMKQLLLFSRQSTPTMERIRLSVLIDEARALVALGSMKRCTLQIDCRTSDDWIEADPTQMKQVIVNLLINACDAMKGEGAIALELALLESTGCADDSVGDWSEHLPKGSYVTLSIRDEGPGIEPEHLDRVFEPFFTTKPSEKGTGLGLSVVQGIMARHSGSVHVRSELGQGACFILVFPSREKLVPSNAGGELTTPPSARRLLYAEDDVQVRDAWSALLKRNGWEVTSTCDGDDAWRQFQTNPGRWHAVLTDLSMPKMTGLELARLISSTTSPPPLILMSGRVSVEEEAQLADAGFCAVLHKPVDQDTLLKVLDKAIAKVA